MKNYIAVKKIIHQLYNLLSPEQKRKSIPVFVSMLIIPVLDLLGVAAVYPLLNIMTVDTEVEGVWYLKWTHVFVPRAPKNAVIFLICLFIIFIYLFKNGASIFLQYIQHRFAADFQRDESTFMLEMYMKRPYEFFTQTNSSKMIRGINGDTESVYAVLVCFFEIIGEILTISIIGVYLFMTDFFSAVFVLFFATVSFLICIFGFKKKLTISGRMSRESYSEQVKFSYQAINGIKEIIVLDRKDRFVERFRKAAEKRAKSQLIYSTINACPNRIIEGVCVSGFIGAVAVRVIIVSNASVMIPVIGTFAMGAFKILPSVARLNYRINTMVFNQPGLQSCYDNYAEGQRIENKAKNMHGGLEEINLKSFKEELVISNISWKYANSDKTVLDGVDIRIHKGEAIALIGESGTGKTTLVDIIMGLYEPETGSVMMDGTSIYKMLHNWRKIIGYIPQSVYLIDDTIRANVAFGLPKEATDDKRVWHALEQAQMLKFVSDLPLGLDTIVGERGVKVSGGQRQRIAIARALYEDPEILVLDEATSSLDNETETMLMESIDALHGHKTLIIVAHRLTTIKNCDKIYEIVDGIAIEKDKNDIFAF